MRPCCFVLSSEGISQGELDQPRCAHGRDDLAEGSLRLGHPATGIARRAERCLYVRGSRVGEVRMVPDIEEIRGKAKLLTFRDGEVLDQREIPVLLVRPTIEISPHVAESGGAGDRINHGSVYEIVHVQVAIEAVMNVARGSSRSNGSAWRQTCAQGWERQAIRDVSRAGTGIEYRKRQPRLEGRDTADRPVTEGLAGKACSFREERQVIAVADREAMRPVEVRQGIRIANVALVIPGRVERG